MMTANGIGAFLGSQISGYLIDKYFTHGAGEKDWHHIWLTFAGCALVVAVLFSVLFKHKHDAKAVEGVGH